MSFEKGHEKKGGRQKGSKNKVLSIDTVIHNQIATKAWDSLLLIIDDENHPDRVSILKALIPYIFTKPLSPLDKELKELEVEMKTLTLELLKEKSTVDLDLSTLPGFEFPYLPDNKAS